MKKIIIIGGGGHAGITYIKGQKNMNQQVILTLIERTYINMDQIFGKLNQIQFSKKLKWRFIVGIGDNFLRYKIVNDLKIKNVNVNGYSYSFISSSRTIKIGIGSLILWLILIIIHSLKDIS